MFNTILNGGNNGLVCIVAWLKATCTIWIFSSSSATPSSCASEILCCWWWEILTDNCHVTMKATVKWQKHTPVFLAQSQFLIYWVCKTILYDFLFSLQFSVSFGILFMKVLWSSVEGFEVHIWRVRWRRESSLWSQRVQPYYESRNFPQLNCTASYINSHFCNIFGCFQVWHNIVVRNPEPHSLFLGCLSPFQICGKIWTEVQLMHIKAKFRMLLGCKHHWNIHQNKLKNHVVNL